jgi:signal peptidase II
MVVVAGLVLVFDQLAKAWVIHNLASGEPRVVIEGLVRLRYTENTGAAFGIFQGATGAISIAAIAIIVAIIVSATRVGHTSRAAMLALGLILGGAIGNLIDRLRFGYVVDFVDLYGPRLHINDTVYTWPVFNVADSAITLGVVLLMVTVLFGTHEPSKTPESRGARVLHSAWLGGLAPAGPASQLASDLPDHAPATGRASARTDLSRPTPASWASMLAVIMGVLFLAIRAASRRG